MTTETVDRDVRALPLGALLRRFRDEAAELAGVEMDLLRSEIAEKRRRAVSAAVMGAAALVAALCATGVLVAAAVLGLDEAMPAWAAALIVGAVLLVAAVAAALAARQQLRRAGNPLPRRTIETVKEDVAWLTTRARSGIG